MPELDVETARKNGVAVPPDSKSDYLEAAAELQPGYVATIDGTDPSIGWTSQHLDGDRVVPDGDDKPEIKAFVPPGDDLPGQVFLPEQLPDPKAALAAGMTPVKIPAHLITENPDHIQGPEPSERATFKYRDGIRAGVTAHRGAEPGYDVDTLLDAPSSTSSTSAAPAVDPAADKSKSTTTPPVPTTV